MVSENKTRFLQNKALSFLKLRLPSARAALSAAATAMFGRLHANETTLLIEKYDGLNLNKLFSAAEIYVSAVAGSAAKTYRAFLPEEEKTIAVSLWGNQVIADNFQGIQLEWRLVTKEFRRGGPDGGVFNSRHFRLRFDENHKHKIVNEYLPYIVQTSEALKLQEEKKPLKLHRLTVPITEDPWQSVNLDHPANFETLAMDEETKKMIVDDLDLFVKRKEFYRKVGKAWKRGFLLFGPPGTGKSSLIAAMANYLKFDVYDLELTAISSNSDLRKVLVKTANRSILVVEDIDASISARDASIDVSAKMKPPLQMKPPLHRHSSQVTLSGLLNFIDGLWSSIGDERIIVFTTNHKEELDPALLRPGRMDVHINMSYCTPAGFRLLANNYLATTEHPLLSKAEELIASCKVTPAEIGEQLLKRSDPELVLEKLIKFLKDKKEKERLELIKSNDDRVRHSLYL